MTENVLTFPGGSKQQAPVPFQVDPKLVSALEVLLEEAKAGKLRLVCIQTANPGSECTAQIHGVFSPAIFAALAATQNQLLGMFYDNATVK